MSKEYYYKKIWKFYKNANTFSKLFMQNKTPAKQNKINFSKIFYKM